MSTHLDNVIETTEKYTEWLTEGIVGSKANDQESSSKDKEEEATSVSEVPIDSDAEFVVSIRRVLNHVPFHVSILFMIIYI